ncbi:NADH-quinone oxidoreductase subunit F [Candidatus Aciduliprofundum boonei]|uniref:NADH dehydrogenase (Quinone) n=1 Tax=Aciduliprofundum boonei (strain DSM 19572 / T469) TaxID=439481 RepID=B5IAM4_ACIB4|nr:NADH-ubiquinone oxidoreductase-F iron-sulfur binding region domain-containing protein [Candidatus Aciduliprofundum boonei]ADD08616.1 NADH dehydrogenase (quinone) [Aciduliprofundum boonei T469]EDY36753.1 Respiratory-chain NADH dehydrogenase 51 Kd subunit family [Aciduliprofundum boonei T469]HII54829.1 NADH dehydrogenase family protein [Candidatus Aciduliprofundum boonei]
MLLLKDASNVEDYLAQGGFKALRKALEYGQDEIISEVETSGLLGRGGAAFPTGLKMKFVRKERKTPKYIVANADEGEPGTFKDRVLMERNPYQILEGMIISAYAIGAKKGFFYIRYEYKEIAKDIERKIEELRRLGILGPNIYGSKFSFDIELVVGAGAYVCGEETALMESIEGKRGYPRIKPPYPAQYGLWGKPTLINNVETLANVPLVMSMGGANYSKLGKEGCTGPKLFSVSGFVKNPGVYEANLGEKTIGEMIELAGGVVGKFKGVMLGGGAAGFILTEEYLDMPLCFKDAKERGLFLGTGDIIVFNESVNIWDILLNIAKFFEHESCGQCFPCRYGTKRMREIIEKIVRGDGRKEDIEKLNATAKAMKIASLCPLGTSAMLAYESAMKNFREELMGVIQ